MGRASTQRLIAFSFVQQSYLSSRCAFPMHSFPPRRMPTCQIGDVQYGTCKYTASLVEMQLWCNISSTWPCTIHIFMQTEVCLGTREQSSQMCAPSVSFAFTVRSASRSIGCQIHETWFFTQCKRNQKDSDRLNRLGGSGLTSVNLAPLVCSPIYSFLRRIGLI